MQVAVMNPDGTGFRQLTEGKDVKTAYMLSPDGKTLVYGRGKERTSGRTRASHFDLYVRDLATGEETRLTNLTFYEISTPHFTPDGKNVVFNNGYPMRLPDTEDPDASTKFNKTYEEQYKGNRIIQYTVDGSGVNRLPEPLFVHGTGSEYPIVTRDGSIWFEGTMRGIHHYRQRPTGEVTELSEVKFNIGKSQSIVEMAVDTAGNWLAILLQDLDDQKACSAHIFDTRNKNYFRMG